MQEIPRKTGKVFPLNVDESGRMVIPADAKVRQALREGQTVVGVEEADGSFRVRPHADIIREIQEYMSQFVPPDVSLVDELLAERRAEAARE